MSHLTSRFRFGQKSLALSLAWLLGVLYVGIAQASSSLPARLQGIDDPPRTLLEQIAELQRAGGVSESHINTWLLWLETDASRLGRRVFQNEPLEAGAVANISQRLTLGNNLAPGGQLLVAKHWQHPVRFQTTDSQAANFVRVTARQSDVVFGVGAVSHGGVYGGMDTTIPLPAFTLVSGSLQAGDEILVEYRNLALPTRAGRFDLPVLFRTDSRSEWFEFPGDALSLAAGQVSSLDVQLPSRIQPGREVSLRVTQLDRFGNRASGSAPSFDVLVNGSFWARIPANSPSVTELGGLSFPQDTVQQDTFQQDALKQDRYNEVLVKSSGGGISGLANPIIVQSGERQVAWGDLRSPALEGVALTSEPSVPLDFNVVAPRLAYVPLVRAVSRRNNGQINGVGEVGFTWQAGIQAGGGLLGLALPANLNYAATRRELLALQGVTLVALGENPFEDRGLDNRKVRLVELAAGNSRFEWYANRLLQAGYRVGFSATAQSSLAPVGEARGQGKTAVIHTRSEDWRAALSRGSTYATTGPKILLHVDTLGAGPGQRTRNQPRREVSGWVRGTEYIEAIELVKNGVVIGSLEPAADPESNQLRVTFASDSAPFGDQRDLPRNGREWLGFLRIQNARIEKFSAPGFREAQRQAIARNGADRVDFITWTRGGTSSFEVALADTSEDTVLELNISRGHEDTDLKPATRPSSQTPAGRHMVSLFDLRQGRVVRTMEVAGYSDEITFSLVNPGSPKQVPFSFVDHSEPREGDYYYIRVRQGDDHMAWSSPVFVGGFDAP